MARLERDVQDAVCSDMMDGLDGAVGPGDLQVDVSCKAPQAEVKGQVVLIALVGDRLNLSREDFVLECNAHLRADGGPVDLPPVSVEAYL